MIKSQTTATMSDKVKTRLEQLDDLEEVNITLTHVCNIVQFFRLVKMDKFHIKKMKKNNLFLLKT